MRLTPDTSSPVPDPLGPGPDLEAAAAAALDERLLKPHQRPVAAAFSGGGDSLALLLAAKRWAADAGRPLLVLTVDHRLQPESAAWTAACAATAARLSLPFQALRWDGEKPVQGLPAAARGARHRLLADAAREAGARVILMGHTADDVLEARAMRADGASTPEPRRWSPSPAWPEGRGLFILRPLLGCRRAQIRRWLQGQGESWIDDPANTDLRFARARARRVIAEGAVLPEAAAAPLAADLARSCRTDAAGGLVVSRQALRETPDTAALRWLAAACACAAGAARSPRRRRVEALLHRLRSKAAVTATLAGAHIAGAEEEVRILREPGEGARGGLAPLALTPGRPTVWDGRFEIVVRTPGLEIRKLGGLASRLSRPERQALLGLPPKARGGLPVLVDQAGNVTCPALRRSTTDVQLRALALERLLAACGAVGSEPA